MSNTTNPIQPGEPAAKPAEQPAATKPAGCLGSILAFFRRLFGKK
jgi:hypothetical protein